MRTNLIRGGLCALFLSLGAWADAEPSPALAHVTRATELARSGAESAALRELDAALTIEPGNVTALRLKGGLVRRSKPREAITVFELLVSIAPQDARAWRGLGNAIQASEQLDRMREALAAYDRAIELDPSLWDAYALRGELRAAQGDLAGLEANHAAWTARAPNDPQAYATLASGLWRLEQSERALQAASRSIELGPTWQAYAARGRMRAKSDPQLALADFKRALTLNPNGASILVSRAELYRDQRKLDLALANANRALTLWPASLAALNVRSDIHLRAGRYDLAVEDIDRKLAIRPGYPSYLNDRCWTRAVGGVSLDSALADCRAALAIAPDDADYLDSLGFLQLRRGDFGASIEAYDRALTAQPELANSLYGRGIAKLRQGSETDGRADLAAARRLSAGIESEFKSYRIAP